MTTALFQAAMLTRRSHRLLPTDGLIFYMPLNETIETAIVNGEEVPSGTLYGAASVTFTTFKGVPCSKWTGSSYVTLTTSLPVTASPYFISIWMNVAATTTKNAFTNTSYPYINMNSTCGGVIGSSSASASARADTYVANEWVFVAIAHDPTAGTYYIRVNDKISTGAIASVTALNASSAYLGAYSNSTLSSASNKRFAGYLAGFRIYNRILEDYEIMALRNEFTPTE